MTKSQLVLFLPRMLAFAAVFAIPVVGFAATQTVGPTSFGAFSAGASGSVSIPQFDPILGTLVQVDLLVTGHSDGGFNKVENLSDFSGTANADIGTNITVSGPSSLSVLTIPLNSASGPIAVYDGTLDWAASPDLLAVFGIPSVDSDSDSLVSGLGPYIGGGNVSYNYISSANTSSSADVAPTASLTSPPTFSFDVSVVYTYNPVPEPATLTLFGLGLAAISVVAARRAKRK